MGVLNAVNGAGEDLGSGRGPSVAGAGADCSLHEQPWKDNTPMAR
jgi:hypothetical protein